MNYLYQPLSLIRELQNELLPFRGLNVSESARTMDQAWTPRVDIEEKEKEFVVFADIPGVDPKEIEIDIEGNTLTLKGERKTFKESKDKEKNYYCIERTSGKFYRQFTLPESVDGNKISAKTKQGVLAIHLPKAHDGKHQRKIAVLEEN